MGLTQRSALSAPKGVGKGRVVVRGEEPTPLEGREAAKGLVEDAQKGRAAFLHAAATS